MKIHPRTITVRTAGNELSSFVFSLMEQHGLTYAEILGLLNETEARLLKFALRQERHPGDPDLRADEDHDVSTE